MQNNFFPKIDLVGHISNTKMATDSGPMRLESINGPETPKFADVVTDMAKNLDDTIKAPDKVMQSAISGSGADIHDVVLAMSKADLSVSVATQLTSKIIQSYEKIMQIQL